MNQLQQSHAPRFERKVSCQHIPDYCYPWLTLNTSLTEALTQAVGELSVTLVHQSRATAATIALNPFADRFPSSKDSALIGSTAAVTAAHHPKVREVVLGCGRQSLVYASTLYDERLHDLIFADLGTTPLGTFVFTDVRFEMKAREWGLSYLPEHLAEYLDEAKNYSQPQWTRSTLYQFQVDEGNRYPLVITESLLFLTDTEMTCSIEQQRSDKA